MLSAILVATSPSSMPSTISKKMVGRDYLEKDKRMALCHSNSNNFNTKFNSEGGEIIGS